MTDTFSCGLCGQNISEEGTNSHWRFVHSEEQRVAEALQAFKTAVWNERWSIAASFVAIYVTVLLAVAATELAKLAPLP